MLEEGNDTPRGDLYSPIWVAITRPVSVICKARLSARGSGLSSSRDDRLVGAIYF